MTTFKYYLDQGDIEFKIHDTQLGKKWWNKFKVKTPKDLESFSPACNCDLGLKTYAAILKNANSVIDGLDYLIWYLKGHGYPIEGKFDINNVRESLNRLHEHFPINLKHQDNSDIHEALKEYNLVIHWLETWNWFRLNNYDKNVVPTLIHNFFKIGEDEKWDFEDEECTFDPMVSFGDVLIVYPQAGRHFTEILLAEDWNVPKEQILLHSKWSANIQINFFDIVTTPIQMQHAYEKFIEMGGKDTFGRDWDDPRLGKGWIKVARLKENQDREKVLDIVNKSTKILGWEEC